jgi:hypothetical protein
VREVVAPGHVAGVASRCPRQPLVQLERPQSVALALRVQDAQGGSHHRPLGGVGRSRVGRLAGARAHGARRCSEHGDEHGERAQEREATRHAPL